MLDWPKLVFFSCIIAMLPNADAADVPKPSPDAISRTINLRITPQWSDDDHFSFLRETDKGGFERLEVDAATGTIVVESRNGNDNEIAGGSAGNFVGGPVPPSGPTVDDTEIELVNATDQTVMLFWNDSNGSRKPYGQLKPGQSRRQHTYVGHVWVATDQSGGFYGSVVAQPMRVLAEIKEKFTVPAKSSKKKQRGSPRANRSSRSEQVSPGVIQSRDGRWQSRVEGNQLQLLDTKSEDGSWTTVELDAVLSESDLNLSQTQFSPDGRVMVAWQTQPGDQHEVFLVESSPKEGGRAKLQSRRYPLPGDAMDAHTLVMVDVETMSVVDLELPAFDFGRPRIRWTQGHELLIEKVDRGHQRFRLFRIDPLGKTAITPIDEQTETFIWTAHRTNMPLVTYLSESEEVLYSSERSGYRHLYRIDTTKQADWMPVTRGDWLVREVLDVDEENQVLDLVVGEYHDAQDPYHRHIVRVTFDGEEETALTQSNGDHTVQFSPSREYLVATHSRVDSPPVHELRRASDGELLCVLATAQRLGEETQTRPLPEVFSAKGRDGETDIWGMITFPPEYDENSDQKYPVIEAIYAGPHDSHVPKKYRHPAWHTDLTSLGFIVVNIDGMGTANRSKAFHDVCWHNLKDAGFPDRIAWMKAAAEKIPAMDLDRVGIYGTSAGGQNACGALLFHGDFYKAAMGSCGCHDNRMDKASWNEQWMGYPVGDHYSASSNIDNAANLEGDLLLIVGELDTNVPPESTYRLVDALIRADKTFDFIMIPRLGHSDGGTYGRRRTWEFFVDKLQIAKRQDKPSPANAPAKEISLSVPLAISNSKPLDLHAVPRRSVWEDVRERYSADLRSIKRRFPITFAPEALVQRQRFVDAWQSKLQTTGDLDSTSTPSSKADESAIAKLIKEVEQENRAIVESRHALKAIRHHVPFLDGLIELCDLGHRGTPIDFASISRQLERVREQTASTWKTTQETPMVSESLAGSITAVKEQFASWCEFYQDYDPEFDWWVGVQGDELTAALADLVERVPATVEASDPSSITEDTSVHSKADDDVLFESILSPEYPNLNDYIARDPATMPVIMKRYSKGFRTLRLGEKPFTAEKETYLTDWQSALESLKSSDSGLGSWSKSEQVDYWLLRQEVGYQLAKLRHDRDHEPLLSRADDNSGLSGIAVGRERLMIELEREFIGNTPEELISLAEAEYVQCRKEMVQAAQEMGYGTDWQAAVEKVKSMHVRVGEQPKLIRSFAEESIAWLKKEDCITIDPLAEASWKMEMMSPERQLVNPFFTGGETISISFPTREMTSEQKRQSLRGNNRPFAKATVHHELIPGHHLQGFQNNRYQIHRKPFGTPFWLEGWAVYWEFQLFENGFAKTPEERLGFLVWRAHRYARILFSLKFHLGRLSPNQCVDFLVDNVGFDHKNATAEVRRSIGSGYPPLYQAAYMLGAMQLRQLANDWDQNQGKDRKVFHDTIMKNNSLPIALVTAILSDDDFDMSPPPMWRF